MYAWFLNMTVFVTYRYHILYKGYKHMFRYKNYCNCYTLSSN